MTVLRPIRLGISLAVIATAVSCAAPLPDSGGLAGTVVTYTYDSGARNWTTETSTLAAGNSPAKGNTVIIRLQPDTPIKEILIDGAFVTGGADPLLDIDGDPDNSGNGTIRIGTLSLETVDARRLEIRDTQVVTTNITNVVAQDNELALTTTSVPVIFVERGGSSTLSLKDSRVDRIRILGVGGTQDVHLERLTVTNSGIAGEIRVEDARIDTLSLSNVSLEN